MPLCPDSTDALVTAVLLLAFLAGVWIATRGGRGRD